MHFFNKDNPEESQNILQAVFDTAVDGIIIINRQGLIQMINKAGSHLFGYSQEELFGQNIKMLMPEPHHSKHDGYLHNYQTTREAKIIGIGREVEGKTKDGKTFPFSLSVSEVKIGEQIIYAGIIHDLTALRKSEIEAEQSQKQLQAIFDTAVDGMIIINRRGLIEMINPAASRLFDYSPEELYGQNIKMLMPEPHHSKHDGYLHNYQTTKKAKIIGIGREVDGKRKDGTLFPFSLGVSEVRVGEKVLYAGIIHDLSEQKAHHEQIERMNQELENKVKERTQNLNEAVNRLLQAKSKLEAEAMERERAEAQLRKKESELREALEKEKELGDLKSRFVSIASHELRTPLTSIKSSAGLLGRYTEAEQQDKRDKHIGKIKASVDNLTGILNDFLSLSKLEEGREENQPKPFLWKVFCEDLLEDFSTLVKPNQEIIHEDRIESDYIVLDKKLLKNILVNVLSNAIKYSEKDIHCSSIIENDILKIIIKDSGMGIPKEEQKHLFTRFFRATNATKAAHIKGTGLGLTIVKRYLELMEGEISFKSEANVGTTFFIEIPL